MTSTTENVTPSEGNALDPKSGDALICMEDYPDCEMGYLWHELTQEDVDEERKRMAKEKLLEGIKKNDMLPFYKTMCETFGMPLDTNLEKELEKKNKEELESLENLIEEAGDKYGDIEVRDGLLKKAHFFCRIGDVKAAVKGYEVAYEKTVGIGIRLDIILTLIRIGFVYGEKELVKKYINRAKEELEKGGDWERRNKLKVYEGLQLMTCRCFKEAAELFLSVLATFSPSSLLPFPRFIFYGTLLSILSLDRKTLREEVVNAPPILEGGENDIKSLLYSFYYGKYNDFMTQLVPIAKKVKTDRYMGRHYLYFIRSIRLRAYVQFLEPYQSVTIQNMADAFGVSPQFIETEVASFIAGGKLSCRIDRVKGVIESNRPDERSHLYLETIKNGDMLLNRIQKLSRVIAM